MNKIHIFTVSFFVVFTNLTGQLIGELIKEVCSNSSHFTDPKFTCCDGIAYDSVVKSLKSESCEMELPPQGEEKIIQTAWTNYQCNIKKQLKEKALNLESFADIMMTHFPQYIKDKIKNAIKNIEKNTYENPMYPEFQDLMGIRSDYYKIEKQVCNKESFMDNGPKRCFSWKERYHGYGDCCQNVALPYQLFPEPFYSHWTLTNFTASVIMNMVGTYEWGNLTYSNNLVQCFKTAKLVLSHVITQSELLDQVRNWTEPDYAKMSDQIIPKFISKFIRDDMIEYMTNNITRESTIIQIRDNAIEHYVSTYEFKTVNVNATKYLYWRCEADRILSARMRNYNITQWCQ